MTCPGADRASECDNIACRYGGCQGRTESPHGEEIAVEMLPRHPHLVRATLVISRRQSERRSGAVFSKAVRLFEPI